MRNKKQEKLSGKKSYFWVAVTVVCLLVTVCSLYYLLWMFNPLPGDEEMIGNFNAHRAEFEELVRRYRDYPRSSDKDTSKWYLDGDTQELMHRAGVVRLHRVAPAWFPNPYSVDSAKRFHEQSKSGQAGKLGLFQKYGTLCVTPVLQPQGNTNRYDITSPLRGVIWKDYCHIPEIPQIDDGELLLPWSTVGKGAKVSHYHEIDGVPVTMKRKRVFSSLNRFPKKWKDYECVYRQIESHWFLRMCNGH